MPARVTHRHRQAAGKDGECRHEKGICGPQYGVLIARQIHHALGLGGIHAHRGVERIIAAGGTHSGSTLCRAAHASGGYKPMSGSGCVRSLDEAASEAHALDLPTSLYLRLSHAMVQMEAAVSAQYCPAAKMPV
jgi:hypothetical protein